MRSNRRHCRPVLESFETRQLLSAGLAGTKVSALVSGASNSHVVLLNGTFHGQYTNRAGTANAGSTFSPVGAGHLTGLGQFGLEGSLQTLGSAQAGMMRGTITLHGLGGNITVKLVAQSHGNGTAGMPSSFTYTIIGGTGQYQQSRGRGSATLTTNPSASSTSLPGVQQGLFSFVFSSGA